MNENKDYTFFILVSIIKFCFDLFSITESGLYEGIHNAEFVLPGYQIHGCDRADRREPRVACFVATPRYELRRVPVPIDINNIGNQNFELVCATVYFRNCYYYYRL